MERSISDLHECRFDIVVIGGGINGASAAQNLAAAGYSCLVVEKGDFGAGASGRSARMLHPGIRYFEARKPLLHFGLHPRRFFEALRGARQAMRSVSEHLQDGGDRIWRYRMCFPIYEDAEFKSWHMSLGLRILKMLGDGKVPFESELVKRDFSARVPFFEDLRDTHAIQAIACYNEFKFDWPERFCMDMLLDAQLNGATLVNYCTARLGEQNDAGDWRVALNSSADPTLAASQVRAGCVVNMAGTWIDDVFTEQAPTDRIVQGTKGTHIVVEMPETYKNFGIASLNSIGLPFYVLPLHKNLFSIGVTETPFKGDATDVTASDDEIDFLIEESNRLLPGRKLSRRDVLRTWAGVRPLTLSKSEPMGSRARKLHDLGKKGFPKVFALTSGPIMTHRETGRLVLDAVSSQLSPSKPAGRVDYTPFAFSKTDNSASFTSDEPDIRVADIETSVTSEYAQSLADVLIRRTGFAWRRNLTRDEVEKAAQIIAPHLDWSAEEASRQVADYMAYQETFFRRPRLDDELAKASREDPIAV